VLCVSVAEPLLKPPVTVKVYVPAGVPPPPPPLLLFPAPQATIVIAAASSVSNINRWPSCTRHARRQRIFDVIPPIDVSASVPKKTAHNPNGLFAAEPGIGRVRAAELPAVVTVTVTVSGDDPFNVIELGDTEQVDCAGAPLQVNCTD